MPNPGIEGTYHLMRRKLPDGTVLAYPEVRGMMTFTREHRNFSVLWRDDAGRFYSECYVARYTLTESEYTETADYLFVNDEIGGKGIRYDLEGTTASAPVTVRGDRTAFDLPQSFEQQLHIRVEFEGPRMTATGKDLFVDYWERVP